MMEGVRKLIAVASGKGGVGKSTTATHLALALRAGREDGAGRKDGGAAKARPPARVGLLDADVYGPSMALMFGLGGRRAEATAERKILPLEAHGVKLMSMAFLSDADKPVIWRGPMVHGLLQQFCRDVAWGELDYLVIDLPPGTGDAQLSLSQSVQLDGVVIVTTPQEVSLIDARKGLLMFRQMKVPVLGIVENMSYFVCPSCDKRYEIFRHGGGKRAAAELQVPFLGEIPIDPRIVVGGDEGQPIILSEPESASSQAFHEFADAVVARLEESSGEGRPSTTPIMPGPLDWK